MVKVKCSSAISGRCMHVGCRHHKKHFKGRGCASVCVISTVPAMCVIRK